MGNSGKGNFLPEKYAAAFRVFSLLLLEFPIAFARISHCFCPNFPLLFARICHCFCPNFPLLFVRICHCFCPENSKSSGIYSAYQKKVIHIQRPIVLKSIYLKMCMWHVGEEQLILFPLVPFLHQVCHA